MLLAPPQLFLLDQSTKGQNEHLMLLRFVEHGEFLVFINWHVKGGKDHSSYSGIRAKPDPVRFCLLQLPQQAATGKCEL